MFVRVSIHISRQKINSPQKCSCVRNMPAKRAFFVRRIALGAAGLQRDRGRAGGKAAWTSCWASQTLIAQQDMAGNETLAAAWPLPLRYCALGANSTFDDTLYSMSHVIRTVTTDNRWRTLHFDVGNQTSCYYRQTLRAMFNDHCDPLL